MDRNKIEWFQTEVEDHYRKKRSTLITSSQINRIAANGTKREDKLSDGAITYMLELAIASEAEPKKQFASWEMDWGNEQEPQAVLRLAEHLGVSEQDPEFIYTSIGGYTFVVYDNKSGGTPDVILTYDTPKIAEIKCPNSDTHLYYCKFLTVDNFAKELPKYYDQMQHNMSLCDADVCYFASYDPRFKKRDKQFKVWEIKANKERQQFLLDKIDVAHKFKLSLIE